MSQACRSLPEPEQTLELCPRSEMSELSKRAPCASPVSCFGVALFAFSCWKPGALYTQRSASLQTWNLASR